MSQGEVTRKRLLEALRTLQRHVAEAHAAGAKPPRLSINAVAKLAGVSHTLIHTKYPDVAERIRAAGGAALVKQRDDKHEALKQAKARNAELRKEVAGLRAENRGLASDNARLTLLVMKLNDEVTALEAGAKRLRSPKPPKD